MEIAYNLRPHEIDAVNLSIRLINNRLSRPVFIDKDGQMWEEPFTRTRRRDMYWIECRYDNIFLGSVAIIPNRNDVTKFEIAQNHCNVAEGYDQLTARIRKWFITTNEYKQQCRNMAIVNYLIKEDEKAGFTTPRIIK